MAPPKKTDHRVPIIVGTIAAIAAIVVAAINLIPSFTRHETKQGLAAPAIPAQQPSTATSPPDSILVTGDTTSTGDGSQNLIGSGTIINNNVTTTPTPIPQVPSPAPKPITSSFGPFGVCKTSVETNIRVMKGDTVRVVSTGTVDFGGAVLGIGAPILDANGDNNDRGAPNDYPAPALMKNSLICKVQSHWYQGGTDKSFIADEDGQLILLCNDAHREDNSRGWQVTVYVTH